MIACNSHGHPPLDPDRPYETLLELPDFYLELMFTDPVDVQPVADATEPEPLVA